VIVSGSTLKLTFDDGPDQEWTPRVLEELARCDARATFFLVGEHLGAASAQVHATLEAGHEIGLHCQRHIRHSELNEAQIAIDTEAALDVLAMLEVTPKAWRTPWGVTTPASLEVAEHFGLELVGWTLDTHDWRGDSASTMFAAAHANLAEPHREDETVVLMHDALGPGALRTGCEETVALIAPLVALARGLELEVSSLKNAPVSS
jgi:peptidoglycan-N-acetylglucosamine deacetylase